MTFATSCQLREHSATSITLNASVGEQLDRQPVADHGTPTVKSTSITSVVCTAATTSPPQVTLQDLLFSSFMAGQTVLSSETSPSNTWARSD